MPQSSRNTYELTCTVLAAGSRHRPRLSASRGRFELEPGPDGSIASFRVLDGYGAARVTLVMSKDEADALALALAAPGWGRSASRACSGPWGALGTTRVASRRHDQVLP